MLTIHTQLHSLRQFSTIILLIMLTAKNIAALPSTTEWIKAGSISSASLAVSLGMRFVPTPECFWCRTNSFDLTLARTWQASNLRAARITSDVVTFAVVPLLALASVSLTTAHVDGFLQDSLVIVTSAAATTAVTELIKIMARRQRPEATFGYSDGDYQENRSFLSGHTSFSFSVLTSASILAFQRGSRYAPWFAGLSALVATTAGISRIAAAKHWTTDVLAGMVVGIGVGALMPFVILDRKNETTQTGRYVGIDPTINGFQFGFTF